jgi:hypothetical protein
MEFASFADALEDGFVGVLEMELELGDRESRSPYGESRSRVRVENRSVQPVLIQAGEDIRGLVRNRVASASVLVPPRQECVIEVSHVVPPEAPVRP